MDGAKEQQDKLYTPTEGAGRLPGWLGECRSVYSMGRRVPSVYWTYAELLCFHDRRTHSVWRSDV